MTRSRVTSVALGGLALLALAGCGAANAATVPPVADTPAATSTTITLHEMAVDMTSTIAHGKYTFTINNTGSIEHELIGFRTSLTPDKLPMKDGELNEDGAGMTQITDGDNIAPGGTQSRAINLSTPGTYIFLCNLPGHFTAHMYTVVTVT